MHNPECVLENETQKNHWDFEIKTDHLVIVKKIREPANCGLCCSGWPQDKTERKRKEG